MILRGLFPCLLLLSGCQHRSSGHKLENFLDPEESVIQPEASTSLYLRQPRFLFRSSATTTVTSTLSTNTVCYTTIGITGICGRRKKRSLPESAIDTHPIGSKNRDEDDAKLEISPSATVDGNRRRETKDLDIDLNQLSPSMSPDDLESRRDPRFLWYYTTTFATISTTVTSFTATTTVSLTNCIPTTFGINLCG